MSAAARRSTPASASSRSWGGGWRYGPSGSSWSTSCATASSRVTWVPLPQASRPIVAPPRITCRTARRDSGPLSPWVSADLSRSIHLRRPSESAGGAESAGVAPAVVEQGRATEIAECGSVGFAAAGPEAVGPGAVEGGGYRAAGDLRVRLDAQQYRVAGRPRGGGTGGEARGGN